MSVGETVWRTMSEGGNVLLPVKHTDAKQNLTQNGHSRSFKITCFGVSGKAMRDLEILNTNVGLIC